jgi:cytochrome c biogenesis protein CcdA
VFGLVLLVASVGLADSLNPSTVLPALWLVTLPHGGRLGSYTWGVFAVYLAGGLVLVFGPGPALISTLHDIRGPVEHILEIVGGVLVVAFFIVLLRTQSSPPDETPRLRRANTRTSAFMLGAGIMAIELPTAFIYFGVIAAILAADRAALAEISLLLLYNAMFVTPIVAVLVTHRCAGRRFDRWLLSSEARFRHAGHVALTAVAGAGGATLLVLGVTGLLAA